MHEAIHVQQQTNKSLNLSLMRGLKSLKAALISSRFTALARHHSYFARPTKTTMPRMLCAGRKRVLGMRKGAIFYLS